MAKRNLKQRIMRASAAIMIGGTCFQLGSCDPTVRSTLLTGLEATAGTLAQTFVTAFFVSLDDGSDTGQLTTTP